MKKIFFLLGLMLSLSFSVLYAAKAYPGLIKVRQADGTLLTVQIHGDEHSNWFTTSDGAFLKQEGKNYYIAQIDRMGNLKATTFLAHPKDLRTPQEARAIAQQNQALFVAQSKAHTRSIGTESAIPYFPHVGAGEQAPKALVILAEFTDSTFKSGLKAKEVFSHYLTAKSGDAKPEGYAYYTGSTQNERFNNHGSVAQYFHDMSKGNYEPTFDVVGPYSLPHPSAYYGKGDNDNINSLLKDACDVAYNNGVDFSQYDADGDGYVDLVYVIYAGYSASMSGNADDIWPQSGTVNLSTQYNGKAISRYGIHSELNGSWNDTQEAGGPLISGIGLFCHEFSHTLGLPDLYPTYSSAQIDNQGMEYWDLMDGGEYTDNGYTPTPYTPWEMENMGWMDYTELEEKEQQITIEPFDIDRKAYKIKADYNEYILLQNIQQTGWWQYLPAHGMLVYRIDYPYSTVNTGDFPNNTAGKPSITIVPADGILKSSYQVKSDDNPDGKYTSEEYFDDMTTDTYPATLKKEQGATMTVNQILSIQMNNSVMQKPIYNIQESNGIITFDYLKNLSTGINSFITNEYSQPKEKNIYTWDGKYVGNNRNKLPKGAYIIGKKKVIIN